MSDSIQDRKRTDLCDRFHSFPGDTSEGRWITVLFCVVGIGLAVLDFFLYRNFHHIPAVMISICLFNAMFAYIEVSHLFIRQYWYRYHRNLAVSVFLLVYCAVLLLGTYLTVRFLLGLSWHISYIYFPFFLLPPIIVVTIILCFCLFVFGMGA